MSIDDYIIEEKFQALADHLNHHWVGTYLVDNNDSGISPEPVENQLSECTAKTLNGVIWNKDTITIAISNKISTEEKDFIGDELVFFKSWISRLMDKKIILDDRYQDDADIFFTLDEVDGRLGRWGSIQQWIYKGALDKVVITLDNEDIIKGGSKKQKTYIIRHLALHAFGVKHCDKTSKNLSSEEYNGITDYGDYEEKSIRLLYK